MFQGERAIPLRRAVEGMHLLATWPCLTTRTAVGSFTTRWRNVRRDDINASCAVFDVAAAGADAETAWAKTGHNNLRFTDDTC